MPQPNPVTPEPSEFDKWLASKFAQLKGGAVEQLNALIGHRPPRGPQAAPPVAAPRDATAVLPMSERLAASMRPAPSIGGIDKSQLLPSTQPGKRPDANSSLAEWQQYNDAHHLETGSSFEGDNLMRDALSGQGSFRPGSRAGALADITPGLGELRQVAQAGPAGALLAALPFFGIPGAGAAAREVRGIPSMAERWAILTPENPLGKMASPAENAAYRRAFEKHLHDAGLMPFVHKGVGAYHDGGKLLQETSYFIPGFSDDEAVALAKRFNQNAVVTPNGYHDLSKRTLFPARGIAPTEGAPYSQFGQGPRFALDIDWKNGRQLPTDAFKDAFGAAAVDDKTLNAAKRVREVPPEYEIPMNPRAAAADSVAAYGGRAGRGGQLDMFPSTEPEYPHAGPIVSGHTVGANVPNMASIGATFGSEYNLLKGVRELPLAHFNAAPGDMFYAADDLRRVNDLAAQIKQSGRIDPLIVGVDEKGPYVLEGGHRLAALHQLGAKSFPAVIAEEQGAKYPQLGEDRLHQTLKDAGVKGSDYKGALAPKPAASVAPPLEGRTAEEHADFLRGAGLGKAADNFLAFMKDSQVREPVFHGTTHDFHTFSSDGGEVENYLGRGHYFSSSPRDVEANYAGEGPDLKSRIEQLTERLMDSEGVRDLPLADTEAFGNESERVYKMARERLHGGKPNVMPAYLDIKNPIELDPKGHSGGGTRFTLEHQLDENGDVVRESGNALDLHKAIHSVAPLYDADPNEIWDHLMGSVGDELLDGVPAHKIHDALRTAEPIQYATGDDGKLIGSEMIQDIYREMGFDGVIMDAHAAFPRMVSEGTKHYIVFNPRQIKSATGNSGAFDPKNPSSIFSLLGGLGLGGAAYGAAKQQQKRKQPPSLLSIH